MRKFGVWQFVSADAISRDLMDDYLRTTDATLSPLSMAADKFA